MSITKTLGGERLGAGKKMKVALHNYERSTHDKGYLWRSTMAAGTLVPFMKELGLPGDTFNINLRADVKTLPTVGPLFGSFKLQLDVFMCPLRLYNAQLHMNKLGVGNDMSKVKFPIIDIYANKLTDLTNIEIENRQINQSSLIAYLGVRGLGHDSSSATHVNRRINAMPLLMYWDIYKNYYANKQEEKGAYLYRDNGNDISKIVIDGNVPSADYLMSDTTYLSLEYNDYVDIDNTTMKFLTDTTVYKVDEVFKVVKKSSYFNSIYCEQPFEKFVGLTIDISEFRVTTSNKKTVVNTFPLSNIDSMRENVLKQAATSELVINNNSSIPYSSCVGNANTTFINHSFYAQNGLGLKTYQSDLFNNWIKTEWIDGPTGINAISSVDTSSGSFTIDTLNLSKKVYDMLNRIAVSGGSYEDWLHAVYSHEPNRRTESPVYMGGMSSEVVFQEVISQTATEDQPLATLAGRGSLANKKGGSIYIKCDEPSYIIGIVSLTPRIDYSQGNDWDIHLATMNDLHKPALDQIGFQDLITDQMAYWELHGSSTTLTRYSAGKQPAWINYMTSVNKCYGNFANPRDQMFMTLNRRYEANETTFRIKDLTTYIDPQKFNYIFADTERDAQNFWVQLGCDITARRKMSAKTIPNL